MIPNLPIKAGQTEWTIPFISAPDGGPQSLEAKQTVLIKYLIPSNVGPISTSDSAAAKSLIDSYSNFLI